MTNQDKELRILSRFTAMKRLHLTRLSREESDRLRSSLKFLYSEKMLSTSELARKVGKSQNFVWSLCKRIGISLRTRDEGKALAAPLRVKTRRRSFSGDQAEMMYLRGFAQGDLDVRRASSNAIAVSTTTTHPAFTACFRRLFEEYGPVYEYPIFDRKSGCKWKLASRLDNSFSFLLPMRAPVRQSVGNAALFFSWLAGLVDSDGSINIVESGRYARMNIYLANEDDSLLREVGSQLRHLGFHPTGPYLSGAEGTTTPARGIRYNSNAWSLFLQRNNEVRRLVGLLPLRHPEKISKKTLILKIPQRPNGAA